MDDRLAYIALNSIPEIGPIRVRALLNVIESPAAILRASVASLQRVHGVGEAVAAAVAGWRDFGDPQEELERAERAGVEVVTLADDAYPALLREIYDPPLCLYVRGDVAAIRSGNAAIAIVGSRRTTHYGVRMAELLAGSAAMAGWTVYSGLARGIDTVAHESVLKLGGRTVAVVGSGLGRIYPQENIELARRIADSAAIVSEFPMLFPPSKRTFPMRNRIISGLTLGTIVVQAGDRSGSLITATQALEQNRAVFAVPGPVDSPQSRGCHGLIKQGAAKLVENFQDVLDEFAFLPGIHVAEKAAKSGEPEPQSLFGDLTLSECEAKLLALIGGEETAIDDLVEKSGFPAGEVLAAVFTLELKRRLRQLPGRRVVTV